MALELTVTDDADFLHQENEWYPATIDRFTEEDSKFYFDEDGTPKRNIKWVFILDSEPNRETFAWNGYSIHPRSTNYKWVRGIYGEAPAIGAVVDFAKLVGERVAVMFEHYDRSDGTKGEKVARVKGLDEPKVEPAAPPVTNKDLPF